MTQGAVLELVIGLVLAVGTGLLGLVLASRGFLSRRPDRGVPYLCQLRPVPMALWVLVAFALITAVTLGIGPFLSQDTFYLRHPVLDGMLVWIWLIAGVLGMPIIGLVCSVIPWRGHTNRDER